MRVGLVRRGYSPSGGAERYLKRFGEALAREGHEAVLLASPEWPSASWAFGERVAVRGDGPLAFADELDRVRDSAACDYIYSLERVHSCDGYRAGDGVHRVWLDRRALYEPAWRTRARAFNPKHREILALEEEMMAKRQARCIVVNSNMVRRQIIETYGFPDQDIHTVHNGVPIRSFQRAPDARKRVRERYLLTDDDPLVLFAGSGWSRKGLEFAIRAVSRVAKSRRIQMLVAGRGRRLRPAPGCVHFLGEVESMVPYLEAADLFLLPTIYDPFSNACLEAMAYGLPVITTRWNGFHEVIDSGTHGWLVDRPDDIDGLVAGLEFWADRERRSVAHPAIQEMAEQFTVEANLAQTIRVLEAVTA